MISIIIHNQPNVVRFGKVYRASAATNNPKGDSAFIMQNFLMLGCEEKNLGEC